jgi:hypothetical protein
LQQKEGAAAYSGGSRENLKKTNGRLKQLVQQLQSMDDVI